MALESGQEAIAKLLAAGRPRRVPRWWWIAGAFVLLAVVVVVWRGTGGNGKRPAWQTAEVHRGDLTSAVSATGTLQPVNKVDVGSELSGTIASVHADFNDRVKRGEVLARLDTEILEAREVEARAAVTSAKAKEQDAAATVTETRLALRRCEELAPRQMCAASDLDKLRAAHERALAAESVSKAQSAQAQALLTAQETNLRKAVIRAPIDGVVLARNVEKGQTVAASFQTPVLFTLADDLRRMELVVAVDEADIGQVRLNQEATFTVAAFPGRNFPAKVTQIRQSPKTVEGVVTYETVLLVNNGDLALLPGMTATADIVSAHLQDVLLVPNAALRFQPPVQTEAKKPSGSLLMFSPPRSTQKAKVKEPNGSGKQNVYMLREGVPVVVPITVGLSDGRNTQVLSGELAPGTAVVVDAAGKAP
jgi:HlyD family secretion protein